MKAADSSSSSSLPPVLTPLAGSAGSAGSLAFAAAMDLKWMADERKMWDAKALKKDLAKLEKDPKVAQKIEHLDYCSTKLQEARITEKLLMDNPSRLSVADDQVAGKLAEVRLRMDRINDDINNTLASPEIQTLHATQIQADLATSLRNTRGQHLMDGGDKLRATVDAGANLAVNATKVGVVAADAGATAVSAVGMVGGAVNIPLGAARVVTGTATAVREGLMAHRAGDVKKNAHDARSAAYLSGEDALAAIAKRVEMKQTKNQVHHTLAAVAGASAAVAGGATVVAGSAAVVAGAMGAGTFGAGAAPAAIVATATGAVATGAGLVATGASVGVVVYDVGRHAHSKSMKQSVADTEKALSKLEKNGMKELPNMTKLENKEYKQALLETVDNEKDNYFVGKLKNRINNDLENNQMVIEAGMKVNGVVDKTADLVKSAGQALRSLPSPGEIMSQAKTKYNDTKVGHATAVIAGAGAAYLAVNAKVAGAGIEAAGKLGKFVTDSVKANLQAVHQGLTNCYQDRKRGIVLDSNAVHKGDSVRAKMNSAREATLTTSDVKAIISLQKFSDKHGLMPPGNAAPDILTMKELQKCCGIKKITRDSSAAAEAFANRLKEDCLQAAGQRNGNGIIAADLPEEAASVKLARQLGMKDADIVRVVNSQMHADKNVQKAGQDSLRNHVRMK